MPKVILNGKETEFTAGESLLAFLQSRQFSVKNLILEWNGQILTEKDPLGELRLKDGDTVDLFSIVGGG
ncbi:MAG: sulfur carrier protein ThiS [Verrucomicrobia bacterium]|jgi:thiamine biosynthesis protein ThiS|nr:sulfur carrier protein ThiS [Verrucomicrobiota bacterium]MBO7524934.1 sulfur carrier protein ThiS [Verrucomicrobiota bacterium]MBR4249042.1 sulfur carrier protein ThiS [Verrucomicrobiota bacterium]